MKGHRDFAHRLRAQEEFMRSYNSSDHAHKARTFTFGVDVARGNDVSVLQVHDKGQVHTFTITDDVRSVSYRGTEIYRR